MLTTKRAILALATGTACLFIYAGCGDDETGATSSGGASCAPTDPACPAVDAECLALTDNSGKSQFHLRMSQLTVNAPPVLTTPLVGGIVSTGLNINLPECNLAGDGTFSLITEFDLDANKIRVGGALPEANPANGYCYQYGNFAPVEGDLTVDAEGNFETGVFPAIRLPIYSDMMAAEVIELPLREARLVGAKLSANNNCIGTFNAAGLQPRDNCKPVPSEGIFYFIDGGTLEGYITLEEADSVHVEDLSQTLCVLLSGDPAAHGFDADPCPAAGAATCKACVRDGMGNITLEGDWCSTTNSAGGCKDSFRLSATFAASAVSLKSDCPADPTSGAGGAGGSGGSGGAGGN